MKVAVATDEYTPIMDSVLKYLTALNYEPIICGPARMGDTAPWPNVAAEAADLVASKKADNAILMCWTGTGVAMAANKVKGIRAAVCADAETARGAKLWNNANVLCLSIRITSLALAEEIMEQWFTTNYKSNPTDDACLQSLLALEERT